MELDTFLFLLGLAMMMYVIVGISRKSQRQTVGQIPALDEINERLMKIERRLENLETIVIERDKKSEFEKL